MVHGTNYGIQYEIHLTRDIDFYDELLPIWSATRTRIEMEKNKDDGTCKLTVIPHTEFIKQLYYNAKFLSYTTGIEKVISETDDVLRRAALDYFLVRVYENSVRHNANLPEPMSFAEYNTLIDKYRSLRTNLRNDVRYCDKIMSKEEWEALCEDHDKIANELQIQQVIHDKIRFEKIKALHNELFEQISLNDEQNSRIQNVLSHPTLQDIIKWQGFTLVEKHY